MPIRFVDPSSLPTPHGYHHAAVASGETVYVSGQIGVDQNGELLAHGDFRAQARQAMLNVNAALAESGLGPEHLAKLTIYVVDPTEENLDHMYKGFSDASKEAGFRPCVTSLVGISAIALPGAVIEVEAIAVAD